MMYIYVYHKYKYLIKTNVYIFVFDLFINEYLLNESNKDAFISLEVDKIQTNYGCLG